MRNKGAKKAKGKYLFFCDNDVELSSDALESLLRHLRANKWAKWCFARIMIDGSVTPAKPERPPQDKHTESYLWYFHCISTMSLIDRKANPIWDESFRRYDDWDLWMTLESKGHKGVFLNKVILKTRNRPTGISVVDNREEGLSKLRKKHKIDPNRKLADIIIPHHNRHDFLERLYSGIDNKLFNIIQVSGGTFSENCNQGAKIAKTDTLIFLNDDVETINEHLVKLANADYDFCGISQYIGSVKYYGIGWDKVDTKPHDGLVLVTNKEDFLFPSGYCFKITRKLWDELGGLDEVFRNGAEDCDLGLKALSIGAKVGFVDYPMVHKHSQSEGRFNFAGENDKIFDKRWPINKLILIKCQSTKKDSKKSSKRLTSNLKSSPKKRSSSKKSLERSKLNK